MRLKRLEIQGYKSFAHRTELLFEDGITAVVGPNGSGKSNIADALRWVLGETNVRHLRGKKSEDLIFAGGDGRSQVGMAQVSLTLDNSSGWYRPLRLGTKADGKAEAGEPNGAAERPVKLTEALLAHAPAEVTITRRVYRDGSNEFFVNGQRARLGDVAQLLSAGGVPGDTFVVVGQGLVDQALALRPEERRSMLDEAAGIKPLQAQRERALARLDETRANLVRVNDILAELTPQLRRLERQANRVQEHQRLSGELEGLLVTWYGYQWATARETVQAAEAELVERRREAQAREKAVQDGLARAEALRVERDRQRAAVETGRRQAGRLREAADTVRRELAVAEERGRQLAARQAELQAEAQSLAEAVQVAQAGVREAEAQAAEAAQAAERAQAELRRLQAEYEAARAEVQQRQVALDTARHTAQRAAHTALDRRTRAESLAERLADLDRAVAEAATTLAEHRERTQAARTRVAEVEAALKTAQAAVTEAEAALNAVRQEARAAQVAVDTAQQGVERAREAQRQAEHRRAMLAEVRRAQLGRAVQKVLDSPRLTGLIGPLAHLLRVPPRLETAVAAALGPQLHAVVVETWADARRAAEVGRADQGSVTLMVVEAGSAAEGRLPEPDLAWLADQIGCDERYRPVVQAALYGVAVADTLDDALAVLRRHPGQPCLRLVTPDGLVVGAGGTLTVGTAGYAATLTHEREWASLPGQAELGAAIRDAQAGVAQAREAAEAVRSRVAAAEAELGRRRQARDAARQAQTEAETALERAATAEAFHQRAHTRQAEDRGRLAQQAGQLGAEAQQAAAAQAQADARVAELAAQPVPDVSEVQGRLGQAQTAASLAQQARQTQARTLDQRRQAYTQADRTAQDRARRLDGLNGEAAGVTRRLGELRAEAERLANERAALRQTLDPAEAGLADLDGAARALDAELAQLREAAVAAERRLGQAQSEAREAQDRARRLQGDIEADLDLLPRPVEGMPQQLRLAYAGQADLPPVTQLPHDLEDRLRTVKSQVRRLGNPDPDALAEFQALSQRHAFLTSQVADLDKAATDLHAVIGELDAAMTTRFSEVFDQVTVRFSRNFGLLFGGGSAKMLLADNGGVEIQAKPPGKRLQPLSLLSGGERALTACALIFALLDVSGTPFCLLDEVDAALDEANVGRFRAALERLAARTQVILVTHNRGSIEAAHAVYGITMGGQGVSQAISLRLRDHPREQASGVAAD